MAHNIFKKDITWFKIASFYNLVSAAAVDCVRQGHPEYLYGLVEAAGLVIERDVATWIANQGGWVSSLNFVKSRISLSHCFQFHFRGFTHFFHQYLYLYF